MSATPTLPAGYIVRADLVAHLERIAEQAALDGCRDDLTPKERDREWTKAAVYDRIAREVAEGRCP